MDWTVTEWNQHSSAFSVKSKKRQVRSFCKNITSNSTGAWTHRDFNLPGIWWHPAPRLQGTFAQINQSYKKKKCHCATQKHPCCCNTGRFFFPTPFPWEDDLVSSSPGLVAWIYAESSPPASSLTTLALNRMGEIPQHMLYIAEITQNSCFISSQQPQHMKATIHSFSGLTVLQLQTDVFATKGASWCW